MALEVLAGGGLQFTFVQNPLKDQSFGSSGPEGLYRDGVLTYEAPEVTTGPRVYTPWPQESPRAWCFGIAPNMTDIWTPTPSRLTVRQGIDSIGLPQCLGYSPIFGPFVTWLRWKHLSDVI